MPSLAPLATGNHDFKYLRERGCAYVDKTAYIQNMLEEETYAFLARPRRFGKSLLVSTLMHLFMRADDRLFQDLDIAAYLPRVPRLPVIALNMAQVGGHTPQEIRGELQRLVRDAGSEFGFHPAEGIPPSGALQELFRHVRDQYESKFVVLVDEYDAPLTGMMTNPAFSSKDQEIIQADLREFYRALKNWGHAIHFAFITGILDIGGSGLFSALNNLWNLSDDSRYDAVCGFTETEIDRFFGTHIEEAARLLAQSPAFLRQQLKMHYDGYRFSSGISEAVYNPISYLTVLKQLVTPQNAQKILDTGFPRPWIRSGQSLFLFNCIQTRGGPLSESDFSQDGVRDALHLQRPSLNALLFQAGFTTFKRVQGATVLGFPNVEVRTAFYEGLFTHLLDEPVGRGSRIFRLVRQMGAAFENGDCAAGLAAFAQTLDGLNYELLEAESNFQLAFQLLCEIASALLISDGLHASSELLTRWGRTDIVVETTHTFYVMELKLNQSVAQAMKQIETQDYLGAFVNRGKRAVGIGVNFDKPGRNERRDASKANYQWDARSAPGTELLPQEIPGNARQQG